MWQKTLITTLLLTLLLHGILATVIRDTYDDSVQEYDFVVRDLVYEDSPVHEERCMEGQKLDKWGRCREVW